MTPTSRLLTVVLSAGLALSVWPVRAAQRATREREVLVAILDKSDQVATGIGPADLVLKDPKVPL